MKKYLLAFAAALCMGSAAQATVFNTTVTFDQQINVVNPGLQIKAVNLNPIGGQTFTGVSYTTNDLNLGDSESLDLFVVRTLETLFDAAPTAHATPNPFSIMFDIAGFGTRFITGTTRGVFDGTNSYGEIKFDGPAVIALGGGIGLFINLADSIFNQGPGNTYTPGRANGAVIKASFSVATIPLPATLPLALSAFGLMAFVARRRKTTNVAA